MKSFNIFATGALALLSSTCTGKVEDKKAPNIVYILADDLGYGDLGCYGQQKFSTPNVDRLASEGMMFTQHYAGCTVSAPSRSSLMTGQHTGHTYIRGNKELGENMDGQFPLTANTYTIAKLLKDANYITGAFGKWGLGIPGSEGDPNKQGFDEFWGYNCQRQAHRYYPQYIWHNNQKVILKENDLKKKVTYAPDMIHEEALKFIRTNKDKPFFAFIPLVQPHAELIVPDDEILAQYKGLFEETPYIARQDGADYGSPNFNISAYSSQSAPRATFAAMVARIDKYVGDILELLKELNIDDNTIIIFTSDNGPHQEGGADPDFFDSNSIFRGYKRDVSDGGIRVPMIVRWKGKVQAGTKSDLVSAFWDIMPTFADLANVKCPENTDGISMLPTLSGKTGNQKKHDFLYWEFKEKGGRIAVRMGDWKAIQLDVNKNPEAPIELYDIKNDSEELNNVAEQHPEVIAQVYNIIKREHVKSDIYPFDYEK